METGIATSQNDFTRTIGKRMLIFMDGAFEISKTVQEIQQASWSSGLEVRALFGEMSVAEQDLALAHSHAKKGHSQHQHCGNFTHRGGGSRR